MGKLASNVLKTATVGKHTDGGGLYLFVAGRDAEGMPRRIWVFRYIYLKQRYEIGLAPVQTLSLARARAECERWRGLMTDRRDPVHPIEGKSRLEAEALSKRGAKTLAEVAPLSVVE